MSSLNVQVEHQFVHLLSFFFIDVHDFHLSDTNVLISYTPLGERVHLLEIVVSILKSQEGAFTLIGVNRLDKVDFLVLRLNLELWWSLNGKFTDLVNTVVLISQDKLERISHWISRNLVVDDHDFVIRLSEVPVIEKTDLF